MRTESSLRSVELSLRVVFGRAYAYVCLNFELWRGMGELDMCVLVGGEFRLRRVPHRKSWDSSADIFLTKLI